jgi:hypothetical protein
MRGYFYKILAQYLGVYIRPGDAMIELDPPSDELLRHFPHALGIRSEEFIARRAEPTADYVVLTGRSIISATFNCFWRGSASNAARRTPDPYLLQRPLEASDVVCFGARPAEKDTGAQLAHARRYQQLPLPLELRSGATRAEGAPAGGDTLSERFVEPLPGPTPFLPAPL